MDHWSKIAQASTYQFHYSSSLQPTVHQGTSIKTSPTLYVGAKDHWIIGAKLAQPPHNVTYLSCTVFLSRAMRS